MNAKLKDYSVFPIGLPVAGSIADPNSLGYIYVIGFHEAGIVKIGSAFNPGLRLIELQCGNPFELHLRAAVSIYTGSLVSIEMAAHRLAEPHRIRGEWFQLSDDDALGFVIKAARNKKAKFGPFVHAYEQENIRQRAQIAIDREAEEADRIRTLRTRLGIDETA